MTDSTITLSSDDHGQPRPCPHCGYCPTCGRPPQQMWPPMQPWPSLPWPWTITWGSADTTTGGPPPTTHTT